MIGGAVLVGWYAVRRLPGAAVTATSIDLAAREYVRLAVALGERDHDSIDYYVGPASWVQGIHENPPTYVRIRTSAADLISRLSHLTPSDDAQIRRDYLISQLKAIVGRVDVLTLKHVSFDVESLALFGVRVQAASEAQVPTIRRSLEQLLDGTGDLGARYQAFSRRFIIPRGRIAAVMAAALAGCRRQTLEHLSLPRGESVNVEYVEGAPWSGFSTYLGNYHSLIKINLSFAAGPLDVLNLACHEGYPGHHVFNSIRDWRGHTWPETSVQPTFSPQSLLSEGAASTALQIAFPAPQRLAFVRDVLFPAAGMNPALAERYVRVEDLVDRLRDSEAWIARDYLDQKLEFVRAEEALDLNALMAQGAPTLLYFNQFRSYVVTYTIGRNLVAQCVNGSSPADPWGRYLSLMQAPDRLLPCSPP